MSEEVKFSEDEIKELKELQKGYLDVQAKFGQIKIARISVQRQIEELDNAEEGSYKEFNELQDKEKGLVDGLTEKYGQGTLDPQTGVFTPNK